jgi:hypothetical protein
MSIDPEHLAYATNALEATRKAREARARRRAVSITETAQTMAEARRLLPAVIAAHGDTAALQKRRRDALNRATDRREKAAA